MVGRHGMVSMVVGKVWGKVPSLLHGVRYQPYRYRHWYPIVTTCSRDQM